MTPNPKNIAHPVHSLQSMLRTLSFETKAIPRIVTDGVFGEKTLEAVMTFQREYQLPVHGEVDLNTWDRLVEAYEEAVFYQNPPRGANLFPHAPLKIYPGKSSLYLFAIQGMFGALASLFDEVEVCPVNGVHNAACVKNTRWIQSCGGLEPDGVFERCTWELLCRIYDAFLIRNPNVANQINQ
ncbi:MAG: peptidoglycan-binding domain-containing protein [Evtepia sp.]